MKIAWAIFLFLSANASEHAVFLEMFFINEKTDDNALASDEGEQFTKSSHFKFSYEYIFDFGFYASGGFQVNEFRKHSARVVGVESGWVPKVDLQVTSFNLLELGFYFFPRSQLPIKWSVGPLFAKLEIEPGSEIAVDQIGYGTYGLQTALRFQPAFGRHVRLMPVFGVQYSYFLNGFDFYHQNQKYSIYSPSTLNYIVGLGLEF